MGSVHRGLNIIWSRFIWLFFYPGKTGFVAQRPLPRTKGLSSLKTAPGQKRGLRMESMGLKRGSSFLWVKRYVKEGSRKRNLSPLVAHLGQPGGRILYRELWERLNIYRAPSQSSPTDEKKVLEMGIPLHRGPVGEYGRGASLPGTFSQRWDFIFIGRICSLGSPRLT